nr:maleylacetoacetate isomerase [Agrobacterium sp. LAD9]
MTLYSYWRSTASYRVRIALALKGLGVNQVAVSLVNNGGEQNGEAYRRINSQGRVPSLVLDDGTVLTQSLAIIEYLEEIFPTSPLLPTDPVRRAHIRAAAAIIGCDIHPLHNSSVLNYLRTELLCRNDQVDGWIHRWIGDGLTAVEALIEDTAYCFGPEPGLAEVFLIPQVYAAHRFGVPMDTFPNIARVAILCEGHPAFRSAHPAVQPDASNPDGWLATNIENSVTIDGG